MVKNMNYLQLNNKIGVWTKDLEFLPSKSNPSDAGWDLKSAESFKLEHGGRRFVDTGVRIVIPESHIVGIIKPRSGLAYKFGVDVLAGVIDSGYTGLIKVGLILHGFDTLIVERGMRIAQIIFLNIAYQGQVNMSPLSTAEFNSMEMEKDRKNNGFGSSDKPKKISEK